MCFHVTCSSVSQLPQYNFLPIDAFLWTEASAKGLHIYLCVDMFMLGRVITHTHTHTHTHTPALYFLLSIFHLWRSLSLSLSFSLICLDPLFFLLPHSLVCLWTDISLLSVRNDAFPCLHPYGFEIPEIFINQIQPHPTELPFPPIWSSFRVPFTSPKDLNGIFHKINGHPVFGIVLGIAIRRFFSPSPVYCPLLWNDDQR